MDAIDSNSIVEQMLPYERVAFLWLNEGHNVFWDTFMWIYSGKIVWVPLVITALIVFIYKKPWKQALLFVLCFVLLATLCDQISASIIKPFFERLRPTHHPDFEKLVLVVNDYRGGRFGFISAHSANGFGVATFLSLVFRYRAFTITIFSWATLTAYSRIYLGVHFITDVLGGMLLGFAVGFLVYYIFQFGRKKILNLPVSEVNLPAYNHNVAKILMLAILVLVSSILLISTMNAIYGYEWFI